VGWRVIQKIGIRVANSSSLSAIGSRQHAELADGAVAPRQIAVDQVENAAIRKTTNAMT